MGMRGFEGQGCILADDMGLGKTLMSITLMWTLLNQGVDPRNPTISACRKVVVRESKLFRGISLYAASVLSHVEWYMTPRVSSSIILYSISSIAHNNHTDIYPLENINVVLPGRMSHLSGW